MVDLKSRFRKLAEAGSHLKEGLEGRARNIKEGTQDKIFDKRLELLIGKLGTGTDAERAEAAAELLAMTRERPECLDQVMTAYLTSLATQPVGAQWAVIQSLHKVRGEHPEHEEKIREAIRSCLHSPHILVRQRLYQIWARQAQETKHRKANLGDLLEGLHDPHKDVRFKVAEHLMEISQPMPKTVIQLAGKALADEDWKVTYHGARIAAHIAQDRPELVFPLVQDLESALLREDGTHAVVLEALGLIGARRADIVAPCIELIISKLTVGSLGIKRAAATAVGRIGGTQPEMVKPAVKRLMRMLDEDDWMVHPPVLRAIGRIGFHYPGWFDTKLDHLEHLVDGAVDKDVGRAAQWALERIDGSPPPPVHKSKPSDSGEVASSPSSSNTSSAPSRRPSR